MPTAAEAQAINEAWNLSQSTGTPFVSPVSASEDAFREEMKRQIAFSQNRDDTLVAQSPEFQRIQQQYATQRYGVISSGGSRWTQPGVTYVPENIRFAPSAAGISAEVYLRGGQGAVDVGVAQRAIAQGMPAEYINLAGVNELGQRVNVNAMDYIQGRSVGGLGVVGIDTGVHTQRGDWGPAVIGSSEMQRQSTFIEATNRGIRMADQINRVNEMLSTPQPSKEVVVQPSTAIPIGTLGENVDFLGMLGMGGSAAGQRAFQNATMGRHPGAEYYGLPPGAVEATGRITGHRVLKSEAEIPMLPISGSGAEAWVKRKEGVASREPLDMRTSSAEGSIFDTRAIEAAKARPGYTEPSTLGDRSTQNIRGGFETLRSAGVPMPSRDALLGFTLEAQRQKAAYTPGVRDDLYYSGELQKWAQNKVEVASAYHALGMQSGVPIPANRFEYAGDLAVEFLKGAPKKPSEVFSPVSGQMGAVLPGRKGLQDVAWETARSPSAVGAEAPASVSFAAGIGLLAAAEGTYGPYGKLRGGVESTDLTNRVVTQDRFPSAGPEVKSALPAPFISSTTTTKEQKKGVIETFGRGVERLGAGWGAFDNFVRSKVPTPETLEPGLKMAAAINPLTTPYIITESIGGKSIVTDIALAQSAGGQYKQFYESPLLYGVSLFNRGADRIGVIGAIPFVAQGIIPDRITGSRVPASVATEGESKTPNFQEFVSGRREKYETELAAYEAAGSTDKAKYEDLLKQRSELTRLTTIQYMTESTASINTQIREQDAARKSQQTSTTPDAALYNMLAPAGSQQRNIVEGVGKGISSIPTRLTEITGTDISGVVKAIQATAPKESIETTSREREFLSGLYGKLPGNEWLSKTGGFVTRAVGVSVKPEYQQVSPLGMVSGGGYAAKSKILIPAAAAVVGGLVIQQSQRTGYDLSSYPGIQKAQELWEEHGQPIRAPGAWNLPKITDVVPAPVFEAPGEGYRQIVNAPGEGYKIVVNLPGEGRNLIAKVSESVAVPAVPSVPSSGWGVTEIIRFPKSTIGPEDVISPTYDLSVRAQEKVTEVGRTLVTDRPIFDLSVDSRLKSASEAKEAVVSQFAPDYATKLAQAAAAATGVATTTPFWWTKTDYQSRLAEQDAIAFPEAYGLPASIARPFATPTSIPQPLSRATDLPYAIPTTYPTTPETPTENPPDYSQGPGPKPPRWPEIKTIPGLPWLPDFGGASPTGGIRKGPRKIQLETSYIGPRMYRPSRGSLPRLPAKKPKTRSKKR